MGSGPTLQRDKRPSPILSITLRPTEHEALQRLAEEDGLPRSRVIASLVTAEVERRRKPQRKKSST